MLKPATVSFYDLTPDEQAITEAFLRQRDEKARQGIANLPPRGLTPAEGAVFQKMLEKVDQQLSGPEPVNALSDDQVVNIVHGVALMLQGTYVIKAARKKKRRGPQCLLKGKRHAARRSKRRQRRAKK